MVLRSQVGKARAQMLSVVHRRTVRLRDGGPYVSFTFDDFPRSAFTEGADILEGFGAHATYYVAMGLMNTQNRLGEQFRCADLRTLVERGHEVALHGYDHLSARRTPVETFIDDLARCERAVHTCLSEGVSKNFAYPYGEASLSAKRRVGPRMTSCRGTIPGFNGPDIDLNLLRANPLYGGEDQVARARQLILENTNRGSWLVFYSHDVRDTPSPYGCTPSLLRDTVAFAVAQGGQVLTIAEVMAKISLN
jgi:peptidoglycan/xylan/chitin deacetylase (PgdA/CDA1 family)